MTLVSAGKLCGMKGHASATATRQSRVEWAGTSLSFWVAGATEGFQEWAGGGSTRLVESEGTSDMLGEAGHQSGGGTKIGVG